MTDTILLKKEIDESGLKLNFIAEELDLTPYGLSRKINGLSEFKASEIVKFCELLRLDKRKRDLIFFAQQGD